MKVHAVIVAFLVGAATQAQAATTNYLLDFTDAICSDNVGNPTTCRSASGVGIDQSFGDVPGVLDVRYNNRFGAPTLEDKLEGRLSFFSDAAGEGASIGYADLVNVAYSGFSGNTASIFLMPLNGASVTLNSFDLGSFGGNRSSQVSILDGLGTVLTSTGAITVSSTQATPFANPGTWSSADGIRILFGPDAFNTAIDNIAYSVTPGGTLPPVQPVPLPASALLLLGGLAGLASLRRLTRAA